MGLLWFLLLTGSKFSQCLISITNVVTAIDAAKNVKGPMFALLRQLFIIFL